MEVEVRQLPPQKIFSVPTRKYPCIPLASLIDDKNKVVSINAIILNISVFNALLIGKGLIAVDLLCGKRETLYPGHHYLSFHSLILN